MTRLVLPCIALVAVCGLGACTEKSLEVTNPNAGETQRVLGTPDDAENLLGSYYRRWHAGLYGTTTANNPPTNFEGMANVMSLMNYSSLANNCQNSRAPFSGATNSNAPGNVCSGEQATPYQIMHEVERVSSNFLTSLKGGLNLGSTARENRDKSFAEFLRGLSLGYLALFYDSAAVVTTGAAAEDPGKLVGYKEVMDSGYAALQRAIDYANTPGSGARGFPLPASWIPSPTTFSSAEFIRLIRTYRARFRANVARTPTERAAADWAKVIEDAQNGITSDHLNTTSTTNGPVGGWRRIYDGGTTWHQMPPFFIGMADTLGTYAAWIATPVTERGAGNVSFFLSTPDLRFPQGSTRAAQQADFAIASCQAASTPCKRYFTNRPSGSDQFSGLGFGWSNYDFNRFHSWVVSGDGSARNGNLVFFTKAELDLLEAEGYYRQGDYASAAALINKTRTAGMGPRTPGDTVKANWVAKGGGLPAITALDATSPVPGGNACVPKVPIGPSFTTVDCGNMWDALKYEKRIETAYTHFAPWYLDNRGWGDLPDKTATFWAVPFQDLQARGYSLDKIYGTGIGTGNAPNSYSSKSSYGW